MVPCEPVNYLNIEHGSFDKWSILNPEGFWDNMEVIGDWPHELWPSVIKVYWPNGKLNIQDVVFHLNHGTGFAMNETWYKQLLDSNNIVELL
jgi:hypothetical protein